MRLLFVTAGVLLAAGAAGTAWAISELRDGAAELPRHWWSSLPLAVLTLGAMLVMLAWSARRASLRAGSS